MSISFHAAKLIHSRGKATDWGVSLVSPATELCRCPDKSRYGVDGKRPQLTDLRDSGTICDDADVVCFIHRPEYYKITEDERGNSLIGLAEFIIAKQRMGGVGDVRLKFEGAFSRFSEIEEPKLDIDIESLRSTINTGEVPF